VFEVKVAEKDLEKAPSDEMKENAPPRTLVVDDELSICKACDKILTREGHRVKTALSGAEALSALAQEPFDLLFTDLKMVEMGGMELLEAIRTQHPDIVPVVITGYSTIASVVETMKLGAFDYLPKPFTPDELAAVAKKAWEKRQSILESRAAVEGTAPGTFAGIVGKSPKMQEIFGMIRKVAPTSSTVLIVGETGTGKELVARAVHAGSQRGHKRFAAVDCGSLSINLIESELFGHVRGAFTGAVGAKQGIFEAADGGTVFLDEICNVDLEVQGKLLRFIQEREFHPVGGTEPRRVDVRLIFATNRDLEEMVSEGTFREDLYYRLDVYPIHLPPLRERKEDIPLLALYLLGKVRERSDKAVTAISEGVLKLFEQYEWPGNVRQLESAIERAVISCDGEVIEPRHLPKSITKGAFPESFPIPATNAEFLALKKRLREQAVKDLEREFIAEALEKNNWNVSKAAQAVGIQRPNFQALMRKHGIRSR
jgi:DNA-binding NtrC family response regulator